MEENCLSNFIKDSDNRLLRLIDTKQNILEITKNLPVYNDLDCLKEDLKNNIDSVLENYRDTDIVYIVIKYHFVQRFEHNEDKKHILRLVVDLEPIIIIPNKSGLLDHVMLQNFKNNRDMINNDSDILSFTTTNILKTISQNPTIDYSDSIFRLIQDEISRK